MSVGVRHRPVPEKTAAVIYPDSDGEPMGETSIHVDATMDLYEALQEVFHEEPRVFVAANMFLYYEEGNPNARKSPDVMVVKGIRKGHRRSFKVWVEKAVPTVIIEATSNATWKEDWHNKPGFYAQLGLKKYFLFDPQQDYLDLPLMGFRLVGDAYVPLKPDKDGSLVSRELRVRLRPDGYLLRVIDLRTGRLIPHRFELYELQMKLEQEKRRAQQEKRRAEEQQRQAEVEKQRAQAAEAEAARLRALLQQKRKKKRP